MNDFADTEDTVTPNLPDCDHRYVVLVYEDDFGADWQCRECGFDGYDANY